jgi:hypothetical protein
MSGFEIAGLVLAILPLILEGLGAIPESKLQKFMGAKYRKTEIRETVAVNAGETSIRRHPYLYANKWLIDGRSDCRFGISCRKGFQIFGGTERTFESESDAGGRFSKDDVASNVASNVASGVACRIDLV